MSTNSRDSRGFLAVVSPCSVCKNRRSAPDTDDNGKKNFCPRLNWQITQKAMQASSQQDVQKAAQSLNHLTLSGTGTTSTSSLVNPVYDPTGESILIWIASLQDNDAVLDDNGNIVNPSLVMGQGSFDTDYIVCNQVPFTPEDSTTDLRSKGGLKEWDTVLATSLTQQVSNDELTNAHVGGTVKRISFLYGSSQPDVPDHDNPET